MHSRFLPLAPLAFLLTAATAFAASTSIKMSTEVWHLDAPVSITGGNLTGDYPDSRKLCLAPDSSPTQPICFYPTNNPSIKSWTATGIVIIPFAESPPSGIAKLVLTNDERECYTTTDCQTIPKEREINIGRYTAHPMVIDIISQATGKTATGIMLGDSYTIKGLVFSSSTGSIFFGYRPLETPDIVSWTNYSIVIKPSKNLDFKSGIRVNNGAADSRPYFLPIPPPAPAAQASSSSVKAPSKSSASSRSSAQSSASSASLASSSRSARSSAAPLFSDVPASHSHALALSWAKRENIIRGYEDGAFRPQQTISRAELLKVALTPRFYEALLQPQVPSGFWDVTGTQWFAPYVRFAKARGFVQGYEDGSFRPTNPVTVAEALKMMYMIMDIPVTAQPNDQWYAPYMRHAKERYVLFNEDAEPNAPASRQDVIWILWRLTHLKLLGVV